MILNIFKNLNSYFFKYFFKNLNYFQYLYYFLNIFKKLNYFSKLNFQNLKIFNYFIKILINNKDSNLPKIFFNNLNLFFKI